MITSLNENDEHNHTFFDTNSEVMNTLSNAALQAILIFCDTQPELLNDSNNHYHQVKQSIASEMSSYIPRIFSNSKEEMTPFLTMASRNTGFNREQRSQWTPH